MTSTLESKQCPNPLKIIKFSSSSVISCHGVLAKAKSKSHNPKISQKRMLKKNPKNKPKKIKSRSQEMDQLRKKEANKPKKNKNRKNP